MRQLRWCSAAFLVAVCSFVPIGTAQDTVSVDGFVDQQACYDALIAADADMNRKVVADEYVTFIQLIGPENFLENVTEFGDLPFTIKATFNALACLCSSAGEDSQCCVGDNAHISNEGAAPGEIATEAQTAYLFTVCLASKRSVEQVLTTEAPSLMPSSSPTSQGPTTAPSASPSIATPQPSSVPSAAPIPTPQPVITKQPTTTAAPTKQPTTTAAPTASERLPLEVSYVVQVPDGMNAPLTQSEFDDLEAAMDILAPVVADEVFNSRRIMLRRKLAASVEMPTSVVGQIDAVCPVGAPQSDACRDITASVTLVLDGQDAAEAMTAYNASLTTAIEDGRLQTALEDVNPDTRMTVVGLNAAATPAPASANAGLSGGATAGIAVAAVVAVLASAGLLVARKRHQEKDDVYYAAGTQALADSDQNARDAAELKDGDAMLGASSPDYGKKSKQAVQTSVVAFDTLEGEDDKAMRKPGSGDSSSNAGSSGWSSSAGVSSLNTGSADSLDFTSKAAVGATLAAIGKASAISRDTQGKESEEARVPVIPSVSRGDLDAAIEAGDWAAVGATAALLAAASDSPDSRSHSSRSGRTSSSRGGSAVSSIDAARAAELDHLVDAGDWEGVVLAAAKFEASEEGSKGSSYSQKSGSATESKSIGGSTGEKSSGYSPSVSDSESPSKQQKRAEIRAEVEALVRRVVPEEIDNVDEMMLQFKGREEELVETLRTMQERAVAHKARVQGQKAAKREARNIVQQGGMELPVPGAAAAAGGADEGLSPAAAAGIAAGAAAAVGVAAGLAAGARKDEGGIDTVSSEEPLLIHEDASTPSESVSSGSGKRRTALELAIEAGDWEAVGEAAAMMSDTSVTTASSGEARALAEGHSYDEEDSDVARMRKAGVNADRAAELDNMIDQGDWTGVVAAASRFSKIDSHTEDSSDQESSASESKQSDAEKGRTRSWFDGSSLLDSKKPAADPMDQSNDDDAEKHSDQARKEEEDALAQAEIWMAIANQSKQEGSADVGASDAADWAIARSLSALRSAEARGELSQPAKDGSPPASSSASIGEGSKGDRSV